MENNRRAYAYTGAVGLVILLSAILSGYWAIILALGPSAYSLTVNSHRHTPAIDVFIAHCSAIVVGWVIYLLLVQGIDPTAVSPLSLESFRVVASMLLAIGATATVHRLFSGRFITAHVTATVVALGLLPSAKAIGVIIFVVGVVSAFHAVSRRSTQTGS